MNKDLLQISQMLEANSFDTDKFREIVEHYLDELPVIRIILPEGCKILRSTINNEPNLFDNVQRLSYPPIGKARTDRASLKGKPMFYASIFTSAAKEANAYPRLVSSMETTDILRNYEKTGRVIVTHSLWCPKRNLVLIAFPFDKDFANPCKEILNFIKLWEYNDDEAIKQNLMSFMLNMTIDYTRYPAMRIMASVLNDQMDMDASKYRIYVMLNRKNLKEICDQLGTDSVFNESIRALLKS